jgi:hypothetical protein
MLESQIAALRAEFDQASAELELTIDQSEAREQRLREDRTEMAARRGEEAKKKTNGPATARGRERQSS